MNGDGADWRVLLEPGAVITNAGAGAPQKRLTEKELDQVIAIAEIINTSKNGWLTELLLELLEAILKLPVIVKAEENKP
ncbi:MAG: hypothetical protein KGJ13_07505 [Patescibacteria group bacterium]|nr:hypothetical protein [Patescibacteria group bacterium]